MDTSKVPIPDRGKPRSLRLRLLLWYGALLAITLGFFATLILVLATNAIGQSVEDALRAEARVAALDVHNDLSTVPPYWPHQLSMNVLDMYRDPGMVVEVLDNQGQLRYLSTSGNPARLPISADTTRAVLAGQTIWYTTTVDGESVRVEALPIHVQAVHVSRSAGDATTHEVHANGTTSASDPVVGVLLVAKSLSDVNATLLLLRTLVLFAGLVMLIGTLLGSWIIATQVLRPLTEIAATARAIAASTARGTRLGNLSQRVRRPRGRDELVQAVDTFNEMLASLESATATQHRFVADASHELRVPLTTIQGNLAFLQRHLDELPPEERRAMLSDAYGETLRLTQLVEELLLLARADGSVDGPLMKPEEMVTVAGGSAHKEPLVELDHALLQLVRGLRRRLNVEGSELKLEIGHIEPVRVRGDEESLRRITLILLDNALKYNPSNGEEGPGRVIVSLERVDGQAVLRVRDTGIGIESADLPHIFERFYRADCARALQGTGLGLPIAQTLVERFEGHITVESTPGKGSTFNIWLPLA
jgi:two-component system, OmpR family, sensor kinase